MRKLMCLGALLGSMISLNVHADDLDQIGLLSQQNFRALSEDLAATVGYKATAPAEPLGVVGFDIGFAVTAVKVENPSAWVGATSTGKSVSTLYLPKVTAQKGLPFGIDIGAFYFKVPSSNVAAIGGEVKYALMSGSTLLPAVSVRGALSNLSGIDGFDFQTRSLDVSISKGILMLTPYAGVGRIWVDSEFTGGVAAKESFSDSRSFVGLKISAALVNLTVESDKTGDVTSTTVKFSFGF